jgi:hypothetical protein
MKRGWNNTTHNSTKPNGSQATVHPSPSLSSPYTFGRTDVPNLVAEEEEEGSNSSLSSFSSIASSSIGSLDGAPSRFTRDREQDEEEEKIRRLLKNKKFLEIIGVSLDTIPTETFYFPKKKKKEKKKEEEEERIRVEAEKERKKIENYVKYLAGKISDGIDPNPDVCMNCIHYIWGKMASCEIDAKTSEIMKKAVYLAYATVNPRFISVYLNKSLIKASEKIEEGERKGLENTSICEAVIGCFCISLLETAEYFLQYYSKERLDLLVGEKKLFRLDEIKQLNCFVRFYDENNRSDEYGMILGAYREYWKGNFQSEDGVKYWDRMNVVGRIPHFKAFGMKLYQKKEDPSCYSIIEDELIKLLERIVVEKRKDIFDKTGEQITKTTGFKEEKRKKKRRYGGKKTKNKSKRKSKTNKKKSRKSRTNKKKSRKSKK